MKITKKQIQELVTEEIEKFKNIQNLKERKTQIQEELKKIDYNFILEEKKLRSVEVEYDDGTVIPTNMAAGLSDDEIYDYFKVGRTFNIGDGQNDKLAKVSNVKIIEEKKDPKAEVRNRGDVVFPAGSKFVNDDKDHFPINSENQARNALARASQYDKVPIWYKGSLKDLVKKVQSSVKSKYKDIELTKKSSTSDKG